jgi:twitching motility protein PilT
VNHTLHPSDATEIDDGIRLPTPPAQQGEQEVNKLFRMVMKHEGSNLHLKVGHPPRLRVLGSFQPLEYPPLSLEDVERLLLPLLTPRQRSILAEEGNVSFTHVVGQDECRFRVSLFRQRSTLSLVARRVRTVIPSLEELGLPATIDNLCNVPAGLIIVAGVAGSGKRTTIAAMLDRINERELKHILTIEDSIAFDFTDKRACVTQRELGTDFRDGHQALEEATRQDPDVLFVGELRDAETVEAAIHAAERGRLVFGIINASSMPATINNILDLFPREKRDAIRKALAKNLKAVVGQKLVRGLKKAYVSANEIMIVNPTVRKLISEGMDNKLPDAIKIGFLEGMVDFTENLRQLVERGDIDKQTAFEVAPSPEQLKMALKGIKVASPGILRDEAPAAPVPSPPAAAPTREPSTTPSRRDSLPTGRRQATVRYFTRMYPNYLYRLLVVLSAQEVRKLVRNEVAQATSEGFAARLEEPIEVEPMLPGCTVYPPRREVTVSGDGPVEARFQVVAHIQGGSVEDPWWSCGRRAASWRGSP